MNGMALCAGIDGFGLGLSLIVPGYRTICYVERDVYAASVLAHRMGDKALAPGPIWDDLATFDGLPWRGKVDILTAGFPCQPWSAAGKQGRTDDPRWLWPNIIRIIRQVSPPLVFLENVPGLTLGGIEHVLGDLAADGFDAEWDCFRASDIDAPHLRARILVLGYARGESGQLSGDLRELLHAGPLGKGLEGGQNNEVCPLGYSGPTMGHAFPPIPEDRNGWSSLHMAPLPAVRGVAHGCANWVDELRASGNAIVPAVAAYAFLELAKRAFWKETR